jgi:hypothetical protein
MNNIHFPNVALCCIDNQYPHLGFDALLRSTRHFTFGEVLFFTASNFVPPQHQIANLRIIPIDHIVDLHTYSTFLIKDLNQYIFHNHILIVQWDGFITHPDLWQDQFLQYDYIGAPWPRNEGLLVGNGGFSLRSKKLQIALQDGYIDAKHPEDQCICLEYRPYLETHHGISFAPPELAEQFAFELKKPSFDCFGFHGVCNLPLVLTDLELLTLIEQLPPKFIFTEQFSQFINTCQKVHGVEILVAIQDKVLALTSNMSEEMRSDRLYRHIIKTSIRQKLYRLAVATLQKRIEVTGWNMDALFLLLRIHAFKLFHLF